MPTMARYPRTARDAAIKCISCNAPVTKTIDNRYVCVDCGEAPLGQKVDDGRTASPADD
jgi:predicted RNA-binding Zn-ribbon protein involved in translation (DUF1610 family)